VRFAKRVVCVWCCFSNSTGSTPAFPPSGASLRTLLLAFGRNSLSLLSKAFVLGLVTRHMASVLHGPRLGLKSSRSQPPFVNFLSTFLLMKPLVVLS
jgi:hypothetical protein